MRVMDYGCSDCLDSGKGVSDYVVLAGYVANVHRELGNEVQVVKLPWRTLFPLLLEGEG